MRLLLLTLFVCALGFPTARAQEKIVKDGVELEFTIEPAGSKSKAALRAGEDAVFRFKLRDTATKTPISGVRPAAWISQRERPGRPGPDQCRAKVESYLQGSLRSRPDVDLNTFYLLALNQEPNISVIDPLLGFGGSKLLTLIMLKSPGDDWVLTNDRLRLFVSMPRINQIAVVDTTTWKVVANVDTGVRSTRLALQPDQKYLWVANETGVAVVDTSTLKLTRQIETGAGNHEIEFGANNEFAFVTNRTDGTLSIINVPKLQKLKDVKTGGKASTLAFSPLSKALYVGNEIDGSIAVVDAASHKLLANIPTKPGLKTVRFARGGRWGFVANPTESQIFIFDASTNRLVHEQTVGEAPDGFAFTDNFAYVRSLGTEQVSAIRLASLGKQVDVVKFPGGQNAPAASPDFASTADAFVPAPEPNAMILANPADQMIYYYTEGMAAPMGDFQNYERVPRAVMVVDRSLREEALGVYSTTARLPKAGVYNVSVLLDSPRVVHCFEAVAASNPAIKDDSKTALQIEYLNKETSLGTGEDYKVRFRLTDTETKRPVSALKDVGVLLFLPPGNWQQRQVARSLDDGRYEITLNVPESGVYLLFVESPSKRVQYRQLPYLTLHANAAH
jgi:DNA-binding beta-propeller fold protein YncE